jgi:parallel beta-helix repeat protein
MAENSGTSVIYTGADNTTISGFKIKTSKNSGVTGIYLDDCSYCNINNNNVSNNYLGIYLSNSNNNIVAGNRANSNEKSGIQLVHSNGNTFSNNTVNSNYNGIVLENNCIRNDMTINMVNSNVDYGFYVVNSNSNNFTNNTIRNNNMGIYVKESNMSIISGNDILENIRYGIWISRSHYSIIAGNGVNETTFGIHLDASDNNIISKNSIVDNYISGISMCPASDNNTVFNNYLKNTFNTDIKNRKNLLNIKRTEHVNIVGGPYIGGNFWANPDGTGFSEVAQDKDKDGISDTKYSESNIIDYLPLVPVSNPYH